MVGSGPSRWIALSCGEMERWMFQRLVAARDPLGRDFQANYQQNFSSLGVVFRFETNTPIILEACNSAFHGSEKFKTDKPDFVICLFEDPALTDYPPWPKPVYRGRRNLFYLSIGAGNTAVADLDHRFAVGFLSPAMVKNTTLLRRDFIECLAFTMATHGKGATHSYIHASAIAKGNKGLILSGPACVGKSTLAFACAQRGFHIVADDVVYLKDGECSLTAWGNPWRLRLVPESVKLFPELSRRLELSESPESVDVVEIELEKIFPGCAQPGCDPVALFFLGRSNGPTECQPLDPSEALKLISRDLISDLPEVMEMHCRSWTKLASRGCYILRYGPDLDSVIHTLEQFL